MDRNKSILAKIVDNAAIGMVIAGMDGHLRYGNRAFIEMLGYGAEAYQGLSILDLVHEDDTGAARLQLDRLTRGEVDDYRAEHRFRHADGSALWVTVAVSALRPEDPQEPLYLIVQITNIELQKRAEEALAYSESRWNFALESAGQGVWDHDIVNDTMFYSRMWRIMRGIPPDEAVPQDHLPEWLSRIHPDDLAHVTTNMRRQDEGKDDFEGLEYRERRRDGSYVWILSRGKPVEWDAEGNPIRTLGTDTDITRLKTIEAELAAEKERLRITLEAIGDGMISTDALGNILFMNASAQALTGYSAAEATGRSVREIFAIRNEMTGLVEECPVAVCLAQDGPVHIEDDMVLVGRDGIGRDIRCSSAPVRDNRGVIGAVLVFQDVTHSRALQRQLTHSANHDDLTGLPNRAAFDRALNGAIATARDGNRQHGLLYIDLDRFKPVNDTAGHAAGDALLKQVAQTIRGCCRSHDIAARVGGDEFTVLLQDSLAASAKTTADKIVRAITALAFSWAGQTYRIGASIGIATIGAGPASPLGFMGEADAACYAAKAGGRGIAIAFRDI
ncbi:PAS domain S-box protein [Devosia sp.]|uniref:PAS domain S-box protein n=1 Tax=Devosia sp. TaxID=1871048 RepID=UPI00261CA3CF|nr:PAS domain S-box protein [Devosia sp.]